MRALRMVSGAESESDGIIIMDHGDGEISAVVEIEMFRPLPFEPKTQKQI
jgi:hypothetical protein